MKHAREFVPVADALPGLHYPMPAARGRHRTRDMLTFDAQGAGQDAPGRPLGGQFRTHDGARTVDSTGAFLVGELERLDLTLHEPLAAVTFGRDVPLREDVTLADDVSSFTVSTYASAAGLGDSNAAGTGIAWIGRNTNEITGVGVDIGKISQPLTPWGIEVKYTVMELESAAKVGRPIDQQKYSGMQLKHQMDVDQIVYKGDAGITTYGLVNSNLRTGIDAVTNVANVANGAGGTPGWTTKTPDEILYDVNEILTSAWAAAAWAVMPDTLLIPPAQYGYISTQKVSSAGNVSILKYLLENNLLTAAGMAKLNIYPLKWLIGAAAGGTIGTVDGHDRMVAYTKEMNRVRYPMTMLQRTPVQYDAIYHKSTYYCKLGVLEIVYPELLAYRDLL